MPQSATVSRGQTASVGRFANNAELRQLADELARRLATHLAPPRLLTAKQVAEYLGEPNLSRWTLWRRIRTGKFPPPLQTPVGRRWREADLREWIAAGCLPFPRRR